MTYTIETTLKKIEESEKYLHNTIGNLKDIAKEKPSDEESWRFFMTDMDQRWLSIGNLLNHLRTKYLQKGDE